MAIARAAIREGVDTLPSAHLDERALEIRQLAAHRERLVGQRTALINDLRWHLHAIDPEFDGGSAGATRAMRLGAANQAPP